MTPVLPNPAQPPSPRPRRGQPVVRYADDQSLLRRETPKRFGAPLVHQLQAGETRVVLGAAESSGKTIACSRPAVGLVAPDSGHILLFGEEVTGRKESQLYDVRSKVGILFQEGGLFDSMTVAENVAYPLLNQRAGKPPSPEEVDRRVRESLSFVELEHTLDKFPSELSGGMRRRVGIARAVVTAPQLVLYDSPTAESRPHHRQHHHRNLIIKGGVTCATLPPSWSPTAIRTGT